MSEEQTESNIDAICAGCASDLSKEPHKEDCSIIAKQRAEELAKKAELEKIENQKKIDEEIEKARKEVLEKNNLEVEKIKKQMEEAKSETNSLKIRNQVIDKIISLVPNEKIDRKELLELSVEDLAKVYAKVLKIVREESENEYNVTCPNCHENLGGAKTFEDAKLIQRQHKSEKHPSKGGGWIALALIGSFLVAGAFAGMKLYKSYKAKKQGTEKK